MNEDRSYYLLTDEAWNRALDDEWAEEAPCPTCKGRGVDRHGEDCCACGGLGVWV